MENFLSRLARNPYAPIDGASITRVDELGNGYDDWNNLIAPKFEQPQQTWGETALGVATAPARIATALADSISPYGSEGWRMPPIIDEGVNALSAVGDAYNYGMDQDEINNRALGMAGFMMGGGGIAAGRAPMIAANASKEASALPALLDMGQEARKPTVSLTKEMPFEFVQPEYSTANIRLGQALEHGDNFLGGFRRYGSERRYGEGVMDSASSALENYAERKQTINSQADDAVEIAKAGGHTPFRYNITDDSGAEIGTAKGRVVGDTMHFDWLGGSTRKNDYGLVSANKLGVAALRQLREQVRADFPDVKNFRGFRVSGARDKAGAADKMQNVYIAANADSRPALLGSGQEQDIPDWLLPYLGR